MTSEIGVGGHVIAVFPSPKLKVESFSGKQKENAAKIRRNYF